jgi:hypothetical protein
LFFLKNLENLGSIPKILNEPIFKKGFEIAKITNMNTQEYEKYERNRMIYWENESAMKSALILAEKKAGKKAGKKAEKKAWKKAWTLKPTPWLETVFLEAIPMKLRPSLLR